jgi:hypothetical protein
MDGWFVNRVDRARFALHCAEISALLTRAGQPVVHGMLESEYAAHPVFPADRGAMRRRL